MYSKRHLPDIEQWSQSSGSNVIPRRARPGLAGLRPHNGLLLLLFMTLETGTKKVVGPSRASFHSPTTGHCHSAHVTPVQGYLAHKKLHPPTSQVPLCWSCRWDAASFLWMFPSFRGPDSFLKRSLHCGSRVRFCIFFQQAASGFVFVDFPNIPRCGGLLLLFFITLQPRVE